MEILITFLFSLVVIGLLAWVVSRSPRSRYRPNRKEVVKLLQAVIDGSARQSQWDLFIGYPLYHDPELEQIRLRCVALTQGDPDTEPMASGLGSYLFDRAGREQIEQVLKQLNQLIADEPYRRDF
ncbi:hypothetical protein DV711_18365 [Motiliproteus coralliicola]|uniref:Uncharacterized protein n=1 Tax=Motiliproteus coralliicola TaxID=2283196 RepID=A0A369W8W1_9GAMM|nr:hypothetical protein [Motiliproteus coralliicola]RDE18087.1 hypothetical protein DV711_18365 [Motiliproteus coralliicola]